VLVGNESCVGTLKEFRTMELKIVRSGAKREEKEMGFDDVMTMRV
jgi:hypothetical protein